MILAVMVIQVIRHNLVTFLNPNNTGNAEQAYNNILLAQNTNDAATSFAATLTDTSTSINNINKCSERRAGFN